MRVPPTRAAALGGIALCAAVFVALAQPPWPAWPLAALDREVLADLSLVRSPPLDVLFQTITWLGDSDFVAAATVLATIALFSAGRVREAILFAACVFGAALLSSELKFVFERLRPTGGPGSFPSGHAALATAFYASMALLLTWTRGARFRALVAAFLVAAAVGLSRLYLGVHWLSDVVAGEALGFAAFLLLVYARYVTTRSPRPSTWPSSLTPASTSSHDATRIR